MRGHAVAPPVDGDGDAGAVVLEREPLALR
jgi:hypothetical protein